MAAMQPLPQAIGVSARCCHQKPTTLNFDQHFSWTGGKFTVTDSTGQVVVISEPKKGSNTNKKEFFSPDGQHLFTLRRENFSMPTTYYFENPTGGKFLEMTNRVTFGKSKMEISFMNTAGDGSPIHLDLNSTFLTKHADITWNGIVCARIDRSASYFSSMGKGRYHVDVAPGADVIMIAAVVIGLDMSIEDKDKIGGTAGAISGVTASIAAA